jgi:hypothetical protein
MTIFDMNAHDRWTNGEELPAHFSWLHPAAGSELPTFDQWTKIKGARPKEMIWRSGYGWSLKLDVCTCPPCTTEDFRSVDDMCADPDCCWGDIDPNCPIHRGRN